MRLDAGGWNCVVLKCPPIQVFQIGCHYKLLACAQAIEYLAMKSMADSNFLSKDSTEPPKFVEDGVMECFDRT